MKTYLKIVALLVSFGVFASSPDPVLNQNWFDNDEVSRIDNTLIYDSQASVLNIDARGLSEGGHALNFLMANKDNDLNSAMKCCFYVPSPPDKSSSKPVAYRVWVGDIVVKSGPIPNTSEFTLSVDIPDRPTLSTVNSRKFTYQASSNTITMTASGSFYCAFQMLSKNKEWGLPIYSDFPHSVISILPTDLVDVPCDYTFVKPDNNSFKAYRFNCGNTPALYFKASQDCSMGLYNIDASTLSDPKLTLLKTVELKKGETTRFETSNADNKQLVAILYDVKNNAANREDDVFLRIMYENNRLPKPVISFDPQTWEVSMSCSDKRAKIHYTLDGYQPNIDSPLYEGPIKLERYTRVMAIASYGDLADSYVADEVFDGYNMRIPTPALEFAGGANVNEFMLTNSLEGVTTYYVIGNGNLKDEMDRKTFDGKPFVIEDGAALKAYSVKEGLTDSEVLSLTVRHTDFVTQSPKLANTRTEGENEADFNAIRNFVQLSVPEGKARYRILSGKQEFQYGEGIEDDEWNEYGGEWIELPGGPFSGNRTVQAFAESTGGKARSAVVSYYTDWVKALKPKTSYDNYRLKLTTGMPNGVIMYNTGTYNPETAHEYKEAELPDGIDLSGISSVTAWVQAVGYAPSDLVTVNKDDYNLVVPSIEYKDDGYLHVTHETEGVNIKLDLQPGNQKIDTIASNHLRFIPAYNTTVEAYATKKGYNNSVKAVKHPLPKPEIVVDGFNVEIRSERGKVYYTTDKTTPTQESIPYTDKFVSGIATIKAACFEEGEIPSEADPKEVIGQTAAPRFEFNFSRKVEDGVRIDTKRIKLHAEAPGTSIYYSFNEAPTESTRKLYDPANDAEEGVDVTGAESIYAYAEAEGMRRSDVVYRNTRDGYLNQPTILVKDTVVEISHNDLGVDIILDFTPKKFDYIHDEYNNRVECEVAYNTSVKAHVEKKGFIESDPATAPLVAKPVINVIGYDVDIVYTEGDVYYTLDGRTPTKKSPKFNKPFESAAGMVRAVAFKDGMIPAEADARMVMDTVAKPRVVEIINGFAKLTTETPNAKIYYNLKEEISDDNGIPYENEIDISKASSIYAFAEAEGYRRSETMYYSIKEHTLNTPRLKYEEGTDDNETGYVVAEHDDNEAFIRFTDGEGNPLEAEPGSPRRVKVGYNSTVYAYAHRKGYVESEAARMMHTDPPVFSLDLFTVTISAKNGQTVYYTTDGNTPTKESNRYDNIPFKVSDNCVVRAVAFADGFIPAEAEPLTIEYRKVAKPQWESYDGRSVTYSAENGAKLRYVLGENSNVLEGTVVDTGTPIDLEGLNKITVIAQLKGADDSETVDYTPEVYANEKDAYTSRPGVLKDGFVWCDDLSGFESISIHGSLNSNSTEDSGDYAFIRSMTALRHLDLSDVSDIMMPDGALADMSLVSVTFPETLRSAGNGIFGSSDTSLCAVLLPSPLNAPANLFDGVSNPNLLLFARNSSLVDNLLRNSGGIITNLVELEANNGEVRAKEVKLTHGKPFYSPRVFKATNISYTRAFTRETQLEDNAGAGWETMVVPFDVQSVKTSDNRTFCPFGNADPDNRIYPYWLFKADNGLWKNESAIQANVPYLLSFPNNPFYDERYCVNGDVVFSATNVEIAVTPDSKFMKGDFGAGNLLAGNYLWTGKDGNVLALNETATLYQSNTYLPGGLFISGERDIPPFECFVESTGRKAIPVFDRSQVDDLLGDSGTRIWGESYSICIRSSIAMKLRIYDMVGQLIRIVDVKAGETVRVDGITPGIYFVGTAKILVKG